MKNPNKFSKMCTLCAILLLGLLPVFGLDDSAKQIGADVLFKSGLDGSFSNGAPIVMALNTIQKKGVYL